jgi:hypothetical protein
MFNHFSIPSLLGVGVFLIAILFGTNAMAAPYDGATAATAAVSAKQILLDVNPGAPDGYYFMDPDGPFEANAVQMIADMTRDGGGWTLGVLSLDSIPASAIDISSNTGTVSYAGSHTRNVANLAESRDAEIRYEIFNGITTVFDGTYTGRFSDTTPAFTTTTDTAGLNGTLDASFDFHAPGTDYDVFIYVRELVTPTPLVTPPTGPNGVILNPDTVAFHFMTTYARFDGLSGGTTETVNPTTLPYSHTSSSSDGTSLCESQYTLSDAGLDLTFNHIKPIAALAGGSIKSHGRINFAVDQDVDFVAEGSYTAAGPAGQKVYLYANLLDESVPYSADAFLFRSTQSSIATANEHFTLGESGGDDFNFLDGPLTGTLIAGHVYSMQYDANLDGSFGSNVYSSTATGSLTLTFISNTPPVPSANSLGLVILSALMGIAGYRKLHA